MSNREMGLEFLIFVGYLAVITIFCVVGNLSMYASVAVLVLASLIYLSTVVTRDRNVYEQDHHVKFN